MNIIPSIVVQKPIFSHLTAHQPAKHIADAIEQPGNVEVNEMVLRPTTQDL
jgi:NADP-dependent 3-hydroxy acid dehydrogenase YdfG